MSKINFAHVNQFKRNGHAPLPKSEKTSEQVSHGVWIGDPKNGLDSIAGVEMVVMQPRNIGRSSSKRAIQQAAYGRLLQKYPKPPKGPSRFRFKPTIPLGTSDNLPYGDQSKRHRAIPTFPTDITPEEAMFYHEWFHSLIREGVIRV
jgi:hypothetical protein